MLRDIIARQNLATQLHGIAGHNSSGRVEEVARGREKGPAGEL